MTIQKRNYKEDFKLLVDLGENYDGEDFELNFWVGSQRCNTYTCSYLDGEYTNCEMADDTNVLCYFDNHGLGTGILFVEIVRYVEDDSMPDGDLKLVTCQRVECTTTDETSETVTTDTSLGAGYYYYSTLISVAAGYTISVTGSGGTNEIIDTEFNTLDSSSDTATYTATEDIEVYIGNSYSGTEELTYTITGETTTYNIKLDLWESDTEDMSATVLALLAPVIKGEPGSSEADGVSYDNTTSELTADNVQDAIDELDATIDTNTTNITNLGLNVGTLTDLTTTDQSSLVAAINEVDANTDSNTTNIATNASAISTLETAVDNNTSSIGNLADLTTTASTDLVSAINEVDANADANATNIATNASAIGTLSDLDTTDQSNLVAAINEVDANADANASAITDLQTSVASCLTDAPSDGSQYARQDGAWVVVEGGSSTSGAAEDITYDNTSSGLTATDVQAAIDEVVASSVSGAAEDITYDNTTSGLTATDVQSALDEIVSSLTNATIDGTTLILG